MCDVMAVIIGYLVGIQETICIKNDILNWNGSTNQCRSYWITQMNLITMPNTEKTFKSMSWKESRKETHTHTYANREAKKWC